jgi:ATP-dependent Clp protease ATP-binding subunit ClpC
MSDIMKPYLTEKIRFIGSTTINEFHSIITDDSALERRFTIIHVNEPSIEQTVDMVTNTKSVFEEHHKCTIPDTVCRYAVENGSRFLGHRKNPDKSLDLVDIACSIMYEKEIKDVRDIPELTGEYLVDIEGNANSIKSGRLVAADRTLNEFYVNQAISSITGIPYDEIRNSLNYNEVNKKINDVIVNQKEAIASVANVVNIFKNIKSDRKRPISIVLMIGGPGVGKKSISRLLAKNLFGSENCFIDYDMSAFGDSFRISELRGSPPGYVGYGKSGGLIKKIRNTPQSVIFFRGINKAHEDIQQYILDSCRTGKMIDSAEREASLNNAIIIFSVTLDDSQQDQIKKKLQQLKENASYSLHILSCLAYGIYNKFKSIIIFAMLYLDFV